MGLSLGACFLTFPIAYKEQSHGKTLCILTSEEGSVQVFVVFVVFVPESRDIHMIMRQEAPPPRSGVWGKRGGTGREGGSKLGG